MNTRIIPTLAAALLVTLCSGRYVLAQTTAFTYQGMLEFNGSPATGSYDFRVAFHETQTGANDGLAQTFPIAANVNHGLFTLSIDLGLSLWTQCSNRWMEIEVRTNGAVAWQKLSPRTLVTPTPYALGAYTACTVADNAVTASSIGSGQVIKSLNGLTDAITLSAGPNVTLTSVGNNIEISAASSGITGWHLGGNSGTTPGTEFLGTTDNKAIEIKVNNTRALRIEPTGASPNLVGGYYGNSANGVSAAVIAGGGTSGSINEVSGNYAFVGGGHGSKAGEFSAVVGGAYNVSPSRFSFIGTGMANSNLAAASVIVGGSNNIVQINSWGSFIGGGTDNRIRSNSVYAAIIGGWDNSVGDGAGAATISGGYANRIEIGSGSASIGGGYANWIQTNASHSVIGGGDRNRLEREAYGTVIGGGSINQIQEGARYSLIGGGALGVIQSNAIYTTIGGGFANVVQPYASFSTIGGGQANSIQAKSYGSVIGGGLTNVIQSNSVDASIAGGEQNQIGTNAGVATIGGGALNVIENNAGSSTITGGWGNKVTAGAVYSSVSGGSYNIASGNHAMIPGGAGNVAAGPFSFAAGASAKALHQGSFVWADTQPADFASTASDQYNVRAANGLRVSDGVNGNMVIQTLNALGSGYQALNFNGYYDQVSSAEKRFNTNKTRWRMVVDQRGTDDMITLDVYDGASVSTLVTVLTNGNVGIGNSNPGNRLVVGNAGSPAYCNGTTWVNGSDRNSKQDFAPVNATEVLTKVVSLPLQSWRYKTQPGDKHMGPVAQDFHAAFGLNGSDDKHIATVDADGVALAAIQGLNQKLTTELARRDAENAELKRELDELKADLRSLAGRLDQGPK